ncbi:hypothetical protein [Saccharothrix sp.]|uniref:hypothetical protein n=1 Tax=Saccharothrix sp. TaxID=1873460 RepID=UPI0028113DBA|nr:hypothetical protein [Saccharothrix sp.]
MGNSTRPGSVVTGERDLATVTVDGEQYRVTELRWNGIDGRSYEVVRVADGRLLTEDGSFDEYPDENQIRALVDTLCAEDKLPSPTAPVSVILPRTGAP